MILKATIYVVYFLNSQTHIFYIIMISTLGCALQLIHIFQLAEFLGSRGIIKWGMILLQGATVRNLGVRSRAEEFNPSFPLTYEIQHPVLGGLVEITSKLENQVKQEHA